MRAYVLDEQGKVRKQLLRLLSEQESIDEIKAFEDYVQFIEQVGKSPPDLSFIRLGQDEIPGLKAAAMVQQVSPDSRIVFVSDDKKHAVDAYEVGAHGYLICPLDRRRLEKCLLKRR